MTYEPILPQPIDEGSFDDGTLYLVWPGPHGAPCGLAQHDGSGWFSYPDLDEPLSPVAYAVPSLLPS